MPYPNSFRVHWIYSGEWHAYPVPDGYPSEDEGPEILSLCRGNRVNFIVTPIPGGMSCIPCAEAAAAIEKVQSAGLLIELYE